MTEEPVGAGGVAGAVDGATATVTVTVTEAAAAYVQERTIRMSLRANEDVFSAAAGATTVYNVAPAMTVTEVSTMTMMQMIACGTTMGSAVPPDEASVIASSAADAASSIQAGLPSAPPVFANTTGAIGAAPSDNLGATSVPAPSEPIESTATPLVPTASGTQSSPVEASGKSART